MQFFEPGQKFQLMIKSKVSVFLITVHTLGSEINVQSGIKVLVGKFPKNDKRTVPNNGMGGTFWNKCTPKLQFNC